MAADRSRRRRSGPRLCGRSSATPNLAPASPSSVGEAKAPRFRGCATWRPGRRPRSEPSCRIWRRRTPRWQPAGSWLVAGLGEQRPVAGHLGIEVAANNPRRGRRRHSRGRQLLVGTGEAGDEGSSCERGLSRARAGGLRAGASHRSAGPGAFGHGDHQSACRLHAPHRCGGRQGPIHELDRRFGNLRRRAARRRRAGVGYSASTLGVRRLAPETLDAPVRRRALQHSLVHAGVAIEGLCVLFACLLARADAASRKA
mmetsp:Transcript_44402/g.142293  ORF Transcript_44402/g.142293 Transcript_44402/m.142293 type:complete len:257 (+) Transcript_44402:1873-2643(+)